MGFFLNPLRREFVARPDAYKGQIVYKWPDATVPKFAQVTVEPDEVAVFFREGHVAGTLQPGRTTLDGANVPFLGGLVDTATNGNFFRSELYFVGTHEFANLPFGGVIDNVVDPDTQLVVGLRVFGDYSLKVVDASALIVNLTGSQNLASSDGITDWMRGQVLKVLRTSVTAQIVRNGWPVIGIASRTDDIEKETLAAVQAQVSSYGVQIVRMGNFTISLDEKDEATLKNFRRDVSYTKLAGSFTQYGAGEALRGIGEGAATGQGGGAGNSALLGIGLGLGNVVTGAVAGGAAAAATPPAPAAPATAGAAHFCSACGSALAADAKFCAQCGAHVTPV